MENKTASIRINYSKERSDRFSTTFPASNILFEEQEVMDVLCYVIKVIGIGDELNLAFSKQLIKAPELLKKGNKYYLYINFFVNAPKWNKIAGTNIYLEEEKLPLNL